MAMNQWDAYAKPLRNPLDDSFDDPSQEETNKLQSYRHKDGYVRNMPTLGNCAENSELTGALSFHCGCTAPSQDADFCDICSRIDFDKLFLRQQLPRQPKALFNLSHILKSNCPLCKFLRSCWSERELNEDSLSSLTLVFGRASPVFGSNKLPETPTFQIYIRNGSSDDSRLILPVHGQPGISGRHLAKERIDEKSVGDWLRICDEYHPSCQSKVESDIAGMQVIDCVTKFVIPFGKETSQYVALSYVWGSGCPDIAECQARHLGPLPKLIEDAILLTCRLGFRYLWIDRYCVPQEDGPEKLTQIQNMGNIYANSTLTLIAAAGTTPEYGIPGVDSTPRSEEISVRTGNYCLVGINRPNIEISKSKWNTRGWTYQEALLSKRRIVITDSQVYFQCQGMHSIESFSVDLRALHSQRRALHGKVDFGRAFPSLGELRKPQTISDRINEFLKRDLSFDSDTLDAIAGILGIYRNLREPVNFFCGLPILSNESSVLKAARSMTDVLAEALLWDAPGAMNRRPEFPSWSWAGWKRSQAEKFGKQVYHFDVYKSFPYYKDHIFPATVVQAEYDDNTILEWESNYHLILKMSDSAVFPRSLNISGWTFNVQLNWENCWKVKISKLFTTNPIRVLDIGLSSDCMHNVLGLVLAHERRGSFDFLLLKPNQNGSSFERISVEYQQVIGPVIANPTHENPVLGALQVTWNTIKIQ